MHSPTQENAMTEIALALAMGFFSLMVLTLISMGAGDGANGRPRVLALAPPSAPEDGAGAAQPARDDLIIVFDGSRFLDTNLDPIDPAAAVAASAGSGRRVVLALDPALPLSRAMAARARIKAPDIVVSALDARWIAALARARGAAQ